MSRHRPLSHCVLAFLLFAALLPRESKADSGEASKSVVRIVNIYNVADQEAVRKVFPCFKEIDLTYVGHVNSYGTGFAVTASGDFVTCAHVVADPSDFGKRAGLWLWSLMTEAIESETPNGKAVEAAILKQYPGLDDTDKLKPVFMQKGEDLVNQKAVVIQHFVGRAPQPGTVEMRLANLVQSDKGVDVALLHAPGMITVPLTLNTSTLNRSEDVYAIGFPAVTTEEAGHDAVELWMSHRKPESEKSPSPAFQRFLEPSFPANKVVRPEVRRVLADDVGAPEIQTIESDVPFGHGHSGGPLLNSLHQVVGVNSQVGAKSLIDTVRFSVHASEVVQLLQQKWNIKPLVVTRHPAIQRPWMLIALIVVAAVIAIGAMALAFIALRRPQAAVAGRTMVMGWIDEARERSRLLRSPQVGSREPSLQSRNPRGGQGRRGGSLPPEDQRSQGGGDQRSRRGEDGGRALEFPTFELEFASSTVNGPPARVVLAGEAFARGGGKLVVGRSTDRCDVVIDHANISKRQASFRIRGENLYIEDLESSNGTLINGQKLEPHTKAKLEIGDTIVFGGVSFRLRQGRSREGAPPPTSMHSFYKP